MKEKITYGDVAVAFFLGAACGFSGGIESIVRNSLLAAGIATACLMFRRRKEPSIIFAIATGALCSLPSCIVSIIFPPFLLVPFIFVILAPVVYGSMFLLGIWGSCKFKTSKFVSFNIIFCLMITGGTFRLFPLLTDPQLFAGAFIGAFASVTPFTVLMCWILDFDFDKILSLHVKFKNGFISSIYIIETALLLILSIFPFSVIYATGINDLLYQVDHSSPGILKDVDYPFIIEDKIYMDGSRFQSKTLDAVWKYTYTLSKNMLTIINVEKGEKAVIPGEFNDPSFKISKNQRMIAVADDANEAYCNRKRFRVYSFHDGKLLFELKELWSGNYCWSGTGKLIVKKTGDNLSEEKLFVIDPITGKSDIFAIGYFPSLALKTGKVYYRRENKIYAKKVGGTEEYIDTLYKVGSPPENRYRMKMLVSPDGKYLLFNIRKYNLIHEIGCYYLIKDLRNGREHIINTGGYLSRINLMNWLSPETAKLIMEKKTAEVGKE